MTVCAASRTDSLSASGHGHLSALTGGYHAAFLIGAFVAAAAAVLGAVLLRGGLHAQAHEPEEARGDPAAVGAEY